MRLEDLQVEIRPNSPGQTASLATRMLQHRPGPLLGAWAFVSLGTVGLAYLLLYGWQLHPGWAWLVLFLGASAFSPPLITTVGHLVFRPQVTFGLVARETLRRTLPFLLLLLAHRVLVLVGLAALVIPGLLAWRGSWFLGPIVLLEQSSLGPSFRRSWRFASGFYIPVLAHVLHTLALLVYLSLAFASAVHFLLVEVFGLTFSFLADLTLAEHYLHFLGMMGFALALPFAMLVWFFVYLDVRIRKEGWDLELAFRACAARMEQRHA